MWLIYEKKSVLKVLNRLPPDVVLKYEAWKRIVELEGPLGLRQIKGFHDEIKGQIITQSFTTAGLDFVEVEQTWQRIESIESLAVQPVISIKVKNVYGDLAVNG